MLIRVNDNTTVLQHPVLLIVHTVTIALITVFLLHLKLCVSAVYWKKQNCPILSGINFRPKKVQKSQKFATKARELCYALPKI